MSAPATVNSSSTAVSSSAGVNTPVFWERLWRTAGIQFVGFFILTSIIYGYQPGVGGSSGELVAFYSGDRTRILIAGTLSDLNLLNLLWFESALRTALAGAGQDGWGVAATASSAAFGGLSLLLISVGTALAYSIANSGNAVLTSGLNAFAWALTVLMTFPRAMLIMSGAFGIWRAGLISNVAFATGVAAVVLGVLGGTTWLSAGIWASDGAFSRFVPPTLLLLCVLMVSRGLLSRPPAERVAW